MLDNRILEYVGPKGSVAVCPTVGMMRYWFQVINLVEFDCRLTNPTFVAYNEQDETYGAFTPNGVRGTLHINQFYNTDRATFIGTLLHEMVHMTQWYDGADLDHGDSFNKLALALSVKYGLDV